MPTQSFATDEIQSEFIHKITQLNETAHNSYWIVTYGCQMNEHESERLAGILNTLGYSKAERMSEATLIIFNTCCVREHAELRVYGNIGALKVVKAANPELKIIVCGCMMQQEGVGRSLMKRYPFVDIVMGTGSMHRLPEFLYQALQGGRVIEVGDATAEIVEDIPLQRQGLIQSITIMYGCNNFCSYCIVPYVRGRERSRAAQSILEEARQAVAQGAVEVLLLGQNVNSYGRDLPDGIPFAQLLRELDQIPGLGRIRFMTSHPKDLSDELIKAMAECEHVCGQLHLPVQSGSNRILKLMNRQYTREQYLELIAKIRKQIPDIGLSTDIIVGFPEETEEDFQDTLSLLEEVGYHLAYLFQYSKRSGTPAAEMEGQVSKEVIKERHSRILRLQNEISDRVNSTYVGKVVTVLPESIHQKNSWLISGRADFGRVVSFAGDETMIGQIVKVKITECKASNLYGELVGG